MRIREFGPGDLEPVLALWVACDLTRPWNDSRADIERKLSDSPELFLVGEVDGTVVATAMAGYDGHRGWVNYLAVLPDRHGQGLGRELMAAVEQRLVVLGCPKVNLQIRDENVRARAFYEAIGYARDPVVGYGKRLISDV